jgi:transposase
MSSGSTLGIDVAKADLEIADWPGRQTCSFPNDATGIDRLCAYLDEQFEDIELVVIEHTDGYQTACVDRLREVGYDVAVVNPRHARHFAMATGQLEKTDAIDAVGLARFGDAVQPNPTGRSHPARRRLASLNNRRRQLVEMRTAEKNRHQQADLPSVQAMIREHIEQLDARIERLESLIFQLMSAGQLAETFELLTSVPGVGRATATELLANLPELGHLNRKEIAKLGGLAPMANDSGQFEGTRSCRGGRRSVKSAMYLVALNAKRCCEPLNAFYERLVEDKNKDPKVGLIALARKMLVIINTMLKHDETFDPARVGSAA